MSQRPGTLLTHLGWSGFRIACPGETEIYIDPPAGCALPLDRETTIFLTHGHPEHVAGTLEHVQSQARTADVYIIASAAVCRYLRRRSGKAADHFQACVPGQHFTLAGIGVDVFPWQHMPLLPPGFRAAVRHVRSLLCHPKLALRIILAGLRGPSPRPMLGFRIILPNGLTLLVYGEGLHRRTGRGGAQAIGTRLPAQLLLLAAEPEDVDVLPGLVNATGAAIVGLYQAHEKWREAFRLPCADLAALASEITEQGKRVLIFSTGTTHGVAF